MTKSAQEVIAKAAAPHVATWIIEALTAAGYVIVPAEPSEAMISAGDEHGGFDAYRGIDNTSSIYRAMLSAYQGQKE